MLSLAILDSKKVRHWSAGRKTKQRDCSAGVSSISPLSERMKELWVVCGLYSEQWNTIGGSMVTWKTRIT